MIGFRTYREGYVIRFVILAVHLLSLALLVVCAVLVWQSWGNLPLVLLIVAGLIVVQFLAIPRPQADKPQAMADGLDRLRAGDAAEECERVAAATWEDRP